MDRVEARRHERDTKDLLVECDRLSVCGHGISRLVQYREFLLLIGAVRDAKMWVEAGLSL